jgi:hypothetical protein
VQLPKSIPIPVHIVVTKVHFLNLRDILPVRQKCHQNIQFVFRDIYSCAISIETLVVNNYPELLPSLHLGRALIVSAAPFHRNAAAKSGRKGLQIDLLLQTRQSVCIVEIKRQRRIGKEVVAEVEEKCRRLARPSGVSLKTALVYDGELAPSVEADAYFDALVPARRLLSL